jgi:hypothetical protein
VKTINNFNLIKKIIEFKTKNLGDFFFIQILKRRKDNPNMNKDMIVIDVFFIKNEDELEDKKNRIIEICETNNARAYIHLNKRNMKKVALQTLRLVAENIASEQYNIRNCYTSACGQYHSDENKTWVIDIDNSIYKANDYINCIEKLEPINEESKILAIIPTKNGFHLISKPFRLDQFRIMYPKVDIHKDNPTILYIP